MTSTQSDQAVTLRTARRLSATQRAFLASQLRHPASVSMNMAWVVRLGAPIDNQRWIAAFDAVVASADILRSRIEPGERDAAEVAPDPTSPTTEIELATDEVDSWAAELAREPFDLATSMYRSVLASHPDGTTTWFLNLHHIATDAATSTAIVERTVAAYLGDEPERSEFYRWVGQIQRDDSPRVTQRQTHWANRPPAARIGRLYRESDRTSSTATRVPVSLTQEQTDTIQTALHEHYRLLNLDLSWAALLVTTSAIYLHRLTGSTDFAIGLPVHHRNTTETATLLGPTMGVYPVDIHVEADDTHASLHRRIARSIMTTLGNTDPSVAAPGDYDAVVNVIPHVAPTANPLVPVQTTWVHPGSIDPEHVFRVQATNFADPNAGVSVDLDVLDQVADADQRQRAPHHFAHVLNGVVSEPDASIYASEMCTDHERSLILSGEVGPEPGSPDLVTDRLRAALQGSTRTVISSNNRELTGAELWDWVVAVAADITGSEPTNARVGVQLGPSIEAVVAIYACLLAGRPFVPLDPEQPATRIASLTERATVTRTFQSADEVLALRPETGATEQVSELTPVDAADEAYLLFTSGSTGVPKGVPITHGGLAEYLDFALDSYFVSNAVPVAPLFTALTFDLTITTLFGPILAGGRLVALSGSGPASLAEFASIPELNWCKATPSHLEVLTTLLPPEHQLATCVVGGEAFRSDLAQRLLAHNSAMAIFNEYGPTEAVVGCMIYRVDPATNADHAAVPIGQPAPGVELRVVDPGGTRVPLGTPGELLIARRGLTSGYLAAGDDETHDPFIEQDGLRFYRSGDLVLRNNDLGLTYLGRVDEQIKVGGVRLDPAEVENALMAHPAIAHAAVRQWSPAEQPTTQHCVRCGLPSNVPDTTYDDQGVCNVCHSYDQVAPIAESWFRTPADLSEQLRELTQGNTGDYDCLHLLSGGKDSTYALYRLVELGVRPYAVTLDNGFISEGALENCRRVAEHLGIDYEVLSTPQMNAIFRDSLVTYSDVCHGCYKTIYTLATNKAVELDIPVIVTGLSRGQLFETRLIPGQFQQDRFDPDAIDRAVVEARKRYHRAPDLPNRVLDTSVFETDDIFESLQYIDIYRYLDVELSEVLRFLRDETPWERPADTGRSSNCLINIAGIHAHQVEQGYHNYAEPYAWDVRLGHKQRDESMAELDDPTDPDEIDALLNEIGYTPAPKQVLTGWYQVADGIDRAPTPTELRSFLSDRLPLHAIPAAFVQVDALVTTANGKLDVAALPAPDREHRAAIGAYLAPESELQSTIVAKWEALLGLNPISVNDDFFALGGDSLAAVTMIIELGAELDLVVREELAFAHTTPRSLAEAIEATTSDSSASPQLDRVATDEPTARTDLDEAPPLSAGELSVLVHQHSRPSDVMYNVGRTFTVSAPVDPERLSSAVRAAVARHEPLTWTYGSPRRRLDPTAAVDFQATSASADEHAMAQALLSWQQKPFDLENGPLLRCRVEPGADQTVVALAIHHVSGDHGSLDQLWSDIDAAYQGQQLAPLVVGYGDFCEWQRRNSAPHQTFWESQGPFPERPTFGASNDEPDGYVTVDASITPEELRTAAGRTPVANVVAAAASAVAPFFTGSSVEVNLVASTRDHDVACDLVGYLLNPLPLQFDRSADRPVTALAADASIAAGQALPHRAFPFANVISDARRRGVQPPSGSVLVSYSDDPVAQLGGAAVQQRMLFNGHAVADVSFFVEPRADHVNLGVEYNGRIVGARTARLILARFDQALRAAVLQLPTTIGELEARPPSALQGPVLDDDELFLSKLLRSVDSSSDNVAVEVDNEQLTWRQLGARATQLAEQLAAQGVRPGDRVAVRLGRSLELPVAIVGVMLAGASYVPVDPTYPVDRIQATISRSGAAMQVCGSTDTPDGPAITVTSRRCGDDAWSDDGQTRAIHPIQATDEAYVIFTSGSTGNANGVSITHQQLANSTNARSQFYDRAPTRFLMLSSIAFDSSIVGLFWSMANGATLVLPTDALAHDIDGLGTYLAKTPISHMLLVPTLYDAILDRSDTSILWPEHVIVAGEACTPRLVARHFTAAPNAQLTNEYGPTEAAVWATAHHCSVADTETVPIGAPIAGTWVAVVDDTGNVVPAGQPGQLVLGGANVAAGYVGDPGSLRFGLAEDLSGLPAEYRGRIFFTGDQAAINDGSVHFLGRTDDQLNVGGARVEPGEIERLLLDAPGVAAAVVLGVDVRPLNALLETATRAQASRAMRSAATAPEPGAALRQALQAHGRPDVRLVAHVVAASHDEKALRNAVAELPATHRPSIYRFHESLPLLPNGKVDRAGAQLLDLGLSETPSSPAPADAEDHVDAVTALYREVLHTNDVAATDSFFDLGGDSLRALELLRLIEDRLGVRLATSAVHGAPTPAGLAQLVGTTGHNAAPTDNTIVMPIQPHGTRTPIFALHNLGPNGAMWRPMSGYLGDDHPLYGIADPFALLDPFGDNYNLEHRPEIHETAALYAEHIQRIAPTGPVVLLGFCLGGVFGYEVAQQLTAAGRTVENLIIVLDWHAPHLEYQENWITLTKLSYRRSGKSVGAHIKGVLQRRAFLKSARRRLEGYAVRAASKLNVPMWGRLRTRQYVEEGIHRIHSYVYEPYEGRITVVRSTEDPRIPTDLGTAGWGDLVGDLEVDYVPGVGERMLYEPNIERATEVVRQALIPRR